MRRPGLTLQDGMSDEEVPAAEGATIASQVTAFYEKSSLPAAGG